MRLNNLRREFIKRVVEEGKNEGKKRKVLFEKLWAGRKVHFYTKLKKFSMKKKFFFSFRAGA
jgi:hypothetical protein